MLLIGAGDLSRHVAATAVGLGYDVVVCDPREVYSGDWDIPGVRLVRTMPDDTVLEMSLDARCAVIALTHDPKLDDLALMEALRTEAFYVGRSVHVATTRPGGSGCAFSTWTNAK
jgi:xanthine dehydrogenase accessory factor